MVWGHLHIIRNIFQTHKSLIKEFGKVRGRRREEGRGGGVMFTLRRLKGVLCNSLLREFTSTRAVQLLSVVRLR